MERSIEELSLAAVDQQAFMPVLSVQQAAARFNTVVEFVRTVMREGIDYGKIPGTDKATLLKPGAEKLCTLFGLTCRFDLVRATEDWAGSQNDGEPFFYYLYRCQLWRGESILSEGDGSCNSFEQKYRYREAQRRCPSCGLAAIIKGKEEYGGGWLCFKKKGGCGMKFADQDQAIISQPVGRVANENIADQVNTIQKMAQKRALIAATLLAVNGSEFFTQDGDERMITMEPSEYRLEGNPPLPNERFEAKDDVSSTGDPHHQESQEKRRLINECAKLSRLLKSADHPDFQNKNAIVNHLRKAIQTNQWHESAQANSFSDLTVPSLEAYLTILERELQGE
jgi:hypothetical protein